MTPYTLYHRRKPIAHGDQPIFYVRLKHGGKTLKRSARTKHWLAAEQFAEAWLKDLQRRETALPPPTAPGCVHAELICE